MTDRLEAPLRFICAVLWTVLVALATSGGDALAQLSESELIPPSRLQFQEEHLRRKNIELPSEQTVEDLFQPKKVGTEFVEPVNLTGVKIQGLTDKDVVQLGLNNFLIVEDGKESKISDLYHSLRLEGKPTFISVDCLLHPYLGYSNALLGSTIEETIYGDLRALLIAMVNSSIFDYRAAEDSAVKDDIQRNLAFLSVGLKLLEPGIRLPEIGGAGELVDADCKAVLEGGSVTSSIFGRKVDFSLYRPLGWMSRSDKLMRFHRAYNWLSRMGFPLSDFTYNSVSGGGNMFRRSILLYRSLVLAPTGKRPPLELWNRIATVVALSGLDSDSRATSIIPPELIPVLRSSERDFARLLRTLSQPLMRTKLLLSIRKQRPLTLGARSIFEMKSKAGQGDENLSMRLFPVVQPPELPWISTVGKNFIEVAEGPEPIPLSLLLLHARGARQASNLLHERVETLDKRLKKWMPSLIRVVRPAGGATSEDYSEDRRWSILTHLLRPNARSVQLPLKGDIWLSRQLETAIAAWLDSYLAYIPIEKKAVTAPSSASGIAGSAKPAASPAGLPSAAKPGSAVPAEKNPPAAKRATFHYLEPRSALYEALANDCRLVASQLNGLACMPERYKSRGDDFIKLFDRLKIIAEKEIQQEPITAADFSLLANIDKIISPVDSSLSSNLFFGREAVAETAEPTGVEAEEKKATGKKNGVTLGLGRAAKLYMVFVTTQGPMLCRGGVYSFYELPGGPMEQRHWDRKVEFGLVRPPEWARRFEIVKDPQSEAPK